MVDGRAQLCSARHAVREPGGKLLHLAGRLAHPFARAADPWSPLPRPAASGNRRESSGSDLPRRPLVAARRRVLRNLPEDPRIRRRRAPNHHRVAARLATIAAASSGVRMSPLPITGISPPASPRQSTPTAPGRCSPARASAHAAPRRSALRPRPSAPAPRTQSASRSSPCGTSR
jgi:hypothetical protein